MESERSFENDVATGVLILAIVVAGKMLVRLISGPNIPQRFVETGVVLVGVGVYVLRNPTCKPKPTTKDTSANL